MEIAINILAGIGIYATCTTIVDLIRKWPHDEAKGCDEAASKSMQFTEEERKELKIKFDEFDKIHFMN